MTNVVYGGGFLLKRKPGLPVYRTTRNKILSSYSGGSGLAISPLRKSLLMIPNIEDFCSTKLKRIIQIN